MINWYVIYAYALSASLIISLVLTGVVRRLALKFDILDHPGERKVHYRPMPLLGGVAICVTFFFVVIFHFLLLEPVRRLGFEWLETNVLRFLGEGTEVRIKLLGVFLGGLIIFALGVVDDLKVLSPELKLIVQFFAAIVLVVSGVHVDLFVSPWLNGAITVAWVVMLTNSLNFLDNMDGLCGGVSIIAALSMFLGALPRGETFVCVLLMVFVGSVAGFLYHNMHPARIFMGDAGAMFCGYMLATVPVLATFYTEDVPNRAAFVAPLIALGVPIFDTVSVVIIRWYRGESIMKGDKRHFSHRLVQLGMSTRQAVEFIYLVAAVTGLGAVLLPHVGGAGTAIIFAQTVGVFMLIVLLMNAGKKRSGESNK